LNISSLGWGEALAETFKEHADAGLRPGRVAIQHRGAYVLFTEEGEVWAGVRGRLRHDAGSTSELPAVGDWVAYDQPDGADLFLDPALIRRYFPYLTPQTIAVLHARRCGWFSGQQLGMVLLEQAKAHGVRLLNGRDD